MTDAGAVGRRMLGSTPDELLAIEHSAGLASRFEAVDAITGALVSAALGGQEIASVSQNGRTATLVLDAAGEHRDWIDQRFDIVGQQALGAWWLPEEASLRPGLLNLAGLLRRGTRFVHGIAQDEKGSFPLAQPDSFLVWAVLQGLFETLLAPIELRGPQVGKKDAETYWASWRASEAAYTALGLDLSVMAPLRPGSGWSQLRIGEQLAAKRAAIDQLAGQVTAVTVRRYRAARLSGLVARYYARAKRESPTQRQVLTRQLGAVLAGYFNGDWLAFLDYLGEAPSPSEQVVTALPQGRLYVAGSERVREVATAKGVPVEEVQRMLATYYGEGSAQSPVEQRVAAMRQYWASFEEIHSRQARRMPSLWGLVDDGFGFGVGGTDQPYNPGVYRQLLAPDLLAAIEKLWGTECLARWPQRIVSTTHPHKNLADAFGPALAFWHGCGLTAWFICEGPSSRTDLPGMEAYYSRDLESLAEAGFPVDRSLFTELTEAGTRLGPPVPIVTGQEEITPGVVIYTNRGSRQEGFEILRDIVSQHRRLWARAHLEEYLRSRWEPELRAVARQHSLMIAVKGKVPTLKQFAKFALPAANAWFAGDVGDLFGALGETPPAQAERLNLMPPNRVAFATLVFKAMGGLRLSDDDDWRNREKFDRQTTIRRLADEAPRYVQLQEAIGRPPDIKEMRAEYWRWADGIETIWDRYAEVVERSRIQAMTIDTPAAQQVKLPLPAPPSSSPQIARPDFPRPGVPQPVTTPPAPPTASRRATPPVASAPLAPSPNTPPRQSDSADSPPGDEPDEKGRKSFLDRIRRR